MNTCLNCGKTEQEIPLLRMRYQEADIYICPQCLPILIHKPAALAAKLPGLENIQPPQHEHD
jgi:hypothetical protein